MTITRVRTRLFLALVSVTVLGLLLAAALTVPALTRQTQARIERNLIGQARLVADVLSRGPRTPTPELLQEEATALSRAIDARVMFIAADGHVVADSSHTLPELATLENHGSRTEIVEAHRAGLGVESGFSSTVKSQMLYVAVPTKLPAVAFVRLELPLNEIAQQRRAVLYSTTVALAVSTACALTLALLAWGVLRRRLDRVAARAERYAAGDLAPLLPDYEDDEIGTVARALDHTVRQLGSRASELARDRARMEAILSGMVEGVLVINHDHRLQMANTAAQRMLRLDAVVPGRHYVELIRHPAVVALLQAALDGTGNHDTSPVLVEESRHILVARAAPVSAAGGGGAVLVLHDITDLQRAEQIRRDFVANVSHELRTPLTAIRGYLEALSDEPADPAERRRFVDVIARHSSRMERLVGDLLRLARLEADQEPTERAVCSVETIFSGVVTELSPTLDAKRQRVEVHVDGNAATIETDAAKLHDALRNLVENASNYSPPESLITLRAHRDHGHVVLSVADEGPGIPTPDLTRVFERFYRVDRARSRDSGGTGLGLSIVKHLVGHLRGRVEAANRQTGGAIFTIILPVPAQSETQV